MAKVTLTQAQAEAAPYYYTFQTLTQKGNVVRVRRRQNGNMREFICADITAAVNRVNSYETYLSDLNKSVSHL